jgi:hypothetical protein
MLQRCRLWQQNAPQLPEHSSALGYKDRDFRHIPKKMVLAASLVSARPRLLPGSFWESVLIQKRCRRSSVGLKQPDR